MKQLIAKGKELGLTIRKVWIVYDGTGAWWWLVFENEKENEALFGAINDDTLETWLTGYEADRAAPH